MTLILFLLQEKQQILIFEKLEISVYMRNYSTIYHINNLS